MGPLRAAALAALAFSAPAPAAPAQPLGIVEQTLATFDPDTLEPAGPALEIGEPHAAPVLSPDGARLAVGLSEPPPPGRRGGRIGLWIVDPAAMEVVHRVGTGIAVEALAFPGVVAALAQDGRLLIVDSATGEILRTSRPGYTHCGPDAVQVGRIAVFVNEVRPEEVEVTTVSALGRVRTTRVRMPTHRAAPGCHRAPLAADPDRGRVLVAGAAHVAAIDVATLRARRHRVGGRGGDSAVLLDGGTLVTAGPGGARAFDVRRSRPRLRWRDRGARAVVGSGRTAVVFGNRRARGRDAASGRVLWRGRGGFIDATAAAGRVYLHTPRRLHIRDLRSGRAVGERPPVLTRIRFVGE